jgi:ABC-2 type transport system ATP-binding protein
MEQLVFMGEMYGMTTRDAARSSMVLLDALGLAPKAGSLASTLSGGMKRRLNLCLALVHNPDVVVLDEPEAGLDPQSRILVRDYIRQLRKQKTVILTTHNMDEADRLSDRVAIIDNGKLLRTDTPENLKKTTGTGDILEVVPAGNGHNLQDAAAMLKEISNHVTVSGDSLLVMERNAIELLPRITSALQDGHYSIAEVKLRAATLEDVFIQLTGKRLRE